MGYIEGAPRGVLQEIGKDLQEQNGSEGGRDGGKGNVHLQDGKDEMRFFVYAHGY